MYWIESILTSLHAFIFTFALSFTIEIACIHGELLTFNRAALIILTPVHWCYVVLSDDVTINNAVHGIAPTRATFIKP